MAAPVDRCTFHLHHWFVENPISVPIDITGDLARLVLPEGVDRRLQLLLDKQDRGEPLSDDERAEAEGLVELADLLSLLRVRAQRARVVP